MRLQNLFSLSVLPATMAARSLLLGDLQSVLGVARRRFGFLLADGRAEEEVRVLLRR